MNGWDFIRLINALRHVSIMISSQDVCDAQICLARFPNISEKQIMKALLIHRPQDFLMFESVWRFLFDDNSLDTIYGEEKDNNSITEESNSPSIGGQGIGRGFGGLSLTNLLTNNSLREVSLIINRQKLEKLANEGAAFDDLVQAALTDLDYYTWINSYDLAYRRGTLTEEEWNILQEYQTLLMDEIRHQVIAIQVNQENCWQPLLRQHWLFKPLSTLTEPEKNLVKSSIRKWARKLAVRTGQRWKTNHRGRIDLTRIIRQSAQWDGLIFRLNYHQQIPTVPELVILCDVSNSMAPFVEFLLFLVSCLRRRFRKLRVYFFIDKVWDVSSFVWDEDFDNIREEIRSWGHKVSLGFSDYGAVFKELAETYMKDVSARATVLLLGDGKNNYRSPEKEYIAQIFARVRRIIWLNPLHIEEWNDPDNIMKVYQPFYTRAFCCSTANDLQRIVKEVF